MPEKQDSPNGFDPWKPPAAKLDDTAFQAPSPPGNAFAALRAFIFAPAALLGTFGGFILLATYGWNFVLLLAAAFVAFLLLRHAVRN